jgi:hypothetical protein
MPVLKMLNLEVSCLLLLLKRFLMVGTALMIFAGYCPAAPQQKTVPASSKSASSKPGTSKSTRRKKGRRKTSWKTHGQQGIQPDRVREIQEALVREKYLTGEPNGVWDDRSQAAMSKYQTDNGWQSKVTPDSRALIKLGLGPDHSPQALLNGAPQASANATTSRSSSVAPDKQ